MAASLFEIGGFGSAAISVAAPPVNTDVGDFYLGSTGTTVDLAWGLNGATNFEIAGYGSASITATPGTPNAEAASFDLGTAVASVSLKTGLPQDATFEIGGFGDTALTVTTVYNEESATFGLSTGSTDVSLAVIAAGVVSFEIEGYGSAIPSVSTPLNSESASYTLDAADAEASLTYRLQKPFMEIGPLDAGTSVTIISVGIPPNEEDASYGLDSSGSSVVMRVDSKRPLFEFGPFSAGPTEIDVSSRVDVEIEPCFSVVVQKDSLDFYVEPCMSAFVDGDRLGDLGIEPCLSVLVFDSGEDPSLGLAPCMALAVVRTLTVGEITDEDCGVRSGMKSAAIALNIYDVTFGQGPMLAGPSTFYIGLSDLSGTEVGTTPRTPVVTGASQWRPFTGGVTCGSGAVEAGWAGVQNLNDIIIGPFGVQSTVRYVSIYDAPAGGTELFRIDLEAELTFAAASNATLPAGALRVGGDYVLI